MKPQRDIHQEVTDIIIRQIEAEEQGGGDMWLMAGQAIMRAVNPTTSNRYRGINQLILYASAAQQKFDAGEWASFKQWKAKGATVRKGEKATPIIFYKQTEKENDEGEKVQFRFVRHSSVFNAAQVDGYEPDTNTDSEPEGADVLAGVEAFVDATGASITEEGQRAFYSTKTDAITMPPKASFMDNATGNASANFYAVLLHELTHWTGGPRRIDRMNAERFGDYAYCAEELIAELGSAFLCAELEISPFPRPDHAEYLRHYLKMMKADKSAIFKAAAGANQAMQLLMELQPADPEIEKEAA